MMKRKYLVSLASIALLVLGTTPAFAVNNPNAPANVSASSNSPANSLPNAGTLSVTWQKPDVDSTHPIPIAYIVTATGGGQTVSTTVPLASTSTINYSTVLSGLTGGTAYAITVTSKTSENATATSASINATPITSPDKPTAISAVASPGSVALTWSAPSNAGGSALTGYIIKDKNGTETTISDPSATTKTFTGLTGGSTASYSIRAKNANGNSEWTAFADATLPSVPDKPTGVTVSPGTTSITVTWVAPTITGNSAITGYKVYLYDNSGAQVGTAKDATSTTYEITSVSPGTYTVKVAAKNLVGDSQLSTASSSVTIAQPSSLLDNTPVFTPTTLPNLVIGATQSVAVTVPSNGLVTITATGTPVGACTLTNGVLTAVAEGTCSVRATSPATSTYAEAIGTKTFTITKTLQTITFVSIANQPLPGPLTVSATASSGLTVAFTASGNCTVSGSTVSFTGQGSCSITATQTGNSTYAAANQVVRTFSITAAPSNGGGSGGGSGGGGSGGGSAPAPSSGGSISGSSTWVYLFIANPDDFTQAYASDACVIFILKKKDGDKTSSPICATSGGAIDFQAEDGDYSIRAYDKLSPTNFKEYSAKITSGTYEVTGAGYRAGSVTRRSITVLKKSDAPNATPSPSATPTTKPSPSTSPSATPTPSNSASPSSTNQLKVGPVLVGGAVTGSVKSSTLNAGITAITLNLASSFKATIPVANKGDKVTVTVKDAKGKSYSVASLTVAKSGSVKLPALKLTTAGKYTITIKVGTKTKVVTLTAMK